MPITLGMKLVDANTFQPAIKYAFASTVLNILLSYNKSARKQITEPMQMVKKLAYSSAGGAIEFANPGPVTNQPIIAHKIRRAYQAYGTPIPWPIIHALTHRIEGTIFDFFYAYKKGSKVASKIIPVFSLCWVTKFA